MTPSTLVKSIADGIAAVVGAAVFSQLPEYVQQYLQRLGGHRDEALRFLQILQADSVGRTSALLADAEARATDLSQAYDVIAQAAPLARPVAFLTHIDLEIAAATLSIFRPAVPLTPEGLFYAGTGLILAVAVWNLLIWLFTRIRRQRHA